MAYCDPNFFFFSSKHIRHQSGWLPDLRCGIHKDPKIASVPYLAIILGAHETKARNMQSEQQPEVPHPWGSSDLS